MIQASCPTCGAPVAFQAEFSTHAVCGSCDSLVVRKDAQVELIGKVAELQPDGSPLQVGTHGSYDGKAFHIVGRIQLAYKDGFWNEWHLVYSDGQSGWLGEAMGEYFVNFEVDGGGALPSQGQLALGDKLALGSEQFVVTGSVTNSLSSYEGELPFIVNTSDPFLAMDLRSASGKAATIDYSDGAPVLYLGEYVSFDTFNFSGLREEGQPPSSAMARKVSATAGVDKFNCPTCGAPQSVDGGVRSKVLVCEYCGSAVDVSNSSLNVIWQEESMRQKVQSGVSLELGSEAKIEGRDYKLIGFLKKSVTYEGVVYPWTEYLLSNPTHGYRWLVDSDGHYSLMSNLAGLPTYLGDTPVSRPGPGPIKFEGETYRHFQTSTARVDAVAGEFYWRVKLGETATNFDYVAPPKLLSMEASESGFVWGQGTYISHDDICDMFGLKKRLRPAVGVAPNQPNPKASQAKSVWRTFWAASIIGFVLLMTGILAGGGKEVFKTGPQIFHSFRHFKPQESKPFKISGHGNVSFNFSSRVSNRWIHVKAELVNIKTNKIHKVGKTLERFYGKGSNKGEVRLSSIPAGEYKLRWDATSGTKSVPDKPDKKQKSTDVPFSITLKRGVNSWGWYFLMLFMLLPVPVFTSLSKSRFETKRWYNSDHA